MLCAPRRLSRHDPRVIGLAVLTGGSYDDIKICTAPPTLEAPTKYIISSYGTIIVLVFITRAVTCYSDGVCEGVFILPDGGMDPRVFLEPLYFTGDTRVIQFFLLILGHCHDVEKVISCPAIHNGIQEAL